MQTWYLAQLKPNAHKIAERNLTRQGFEIFLPMIRETARRPSGFAKVSKPLFPGYVFVRFDSAQGGWRAINSTQGVTKLVVFGGGPAPVPTELVESLKARCEEDGHLTETPEIAPGDAVKVTDGPFAGFVAEVETVAPDQRVWLLLDLMGRQTKVSVDQRALRGG